VLTVSQPGERGESFAWVVMGAQLDAFGTGTRLREVFRYGLDFKRIKP
jgi:hypothetical protein